MQPTEEIKSKLDIVDVIREYIQLKAVGTSFRALCPFHHEKTPSFMVSPEKQIWHCFGCGKGGDIFSFVMETEGLNFAEALRALANKAGVQLVKQDPRLASQRNRLLDIMELASKYYHKTFLESAVASLARKYLMERGITAETIEEWQIGYSPDSWDGLANFLKAKGCRENEIFSAGLSVKREFMRGATRLDSARLANAAHPNGKYGGFYDRFRGRIMFPVRDANGDIVAFSARVLPDKDDGPSTSSGQVKMGKYINSPQTIIYDKSKILFGLDKAKMEIKKEDLAIIVEGQMDVITAHQRGFKNVVASSGTALTGEQVNLLKRYTSNIALAFDTDKAGEMAAERGTKEAMAAEMNVKVIEVPQGKDPDECIKNNPEEWRKAVEAAKPVMQYYFDKTFVVLNLNDIADRRKAVKILLPVLVRLGNKIERDFWLKKLSAAIDVKEALLWEMLQKHLTQTRQSAKQTDSAAAVSQPRNSREEMLSESLLALVFKFPQLIEYAVNHIQPDQVAGQGNQFLYRNIAVYYNNNVEAELNYEGFKLWLENSADFSPPISAEVLFNNVNKLALLGDRDFYNYDYEQAKAEAIKIALFLKKHYLARRMKEVEKLIAQAENENNKKEAELLMEEFKALADEIKEFLEP
ncbi:DNA primase [Candidatus Falkowbacteria bacterium]|nr:DNA primase [Candidatus Falkowbacteria bacterium]